MRTFRYLLWVGVCLLAAPCVSRGEEHMCTLGMQFADVPENFEENPGGYIAVYHAEHNLDNWRALSIYRNCEHTFGYITLSVTGGGGVKIWTEDRQTLLCETGGSHEWPAAEIGGPGQGATLLWVEGTSPSTEPRDVHLHVQWYCTWDDVDLTVFELRVNVDSGNKNGFARPIEGNDDDLIEDAADKPGKILGVNDSDSDNGGDGDGIPGFADGFDLDPYNPCDDATGSEKFVPVLFKISDAVDLENATLWISYDSSDPGAMSVPEPGQPYVPAGGILRLWTVDASAARTKRSVTEKTPQDTVGFYVPPGTYSGANLGKLGFSGQNKTVVLYAEGVRTGVTEISGSLVVHIPEYDGYVESLDAVRLTVAKVDLDVDSDNNNGLNAPDRSDLEDQYEDKAGDPDHPGKFVQVNDGDKDNDGIPDFADGFNAYSNEGMDSYQNTDEVFTPMALQLPACIDPMTAKIKITYPGSRLQDPPYGCRVTRTGYPPNYTYTPEEPGKLRIWNCNGATPRSPYGIDNSGGGDFIESGVAYPAYKFSSTLYIEGIRPSTALGDCRIRVEVDPCGNGDYMVMDAVRVTTFSLDIGTDSNNNGSIDQSEDGFEEFAPGRVLCIDLEGDGPGLDELAPIALRAPNVAYGLVKLETVEGGDRLRLWKDTGKMEEVVLPATWSPPDVPALLYADGIALGQVKLRLSYVIPSEHQLASDTIALFVTETISYAPSGPVMTWEPCNWPFETPKGLLSQVVDRAIENLKDEYTRGDLFVWRHRDTTPPGGSDDFGNCTLFNFRLCRLSGVLVVNAHGAVWVIIGVWASTQSKIQEWIEADGGNNEHILPAYDGETGWWKAAILNLWLQDNWKPALDVDKAIVLMATCHSAEPPVGSCLTSAGGRVGLGYVGSSSQWDAFLDFVLLLGRMNGTCDAGTKRTAGKAYGDGTPYTSGFRLIGNGSGETHKWTVLCPSPKALFPAETVGARRGAGCIVFDTYMDILNAADEAVIVESGSGGCSARRWFGNAMGAYGISFDFDKRNFGGILMRAVAEKCAAKIFGAVPRHNLDGDGIQPNLDDKEWDF